MGGSGMMEGWRKDGEIFDVLSAYRMREDFYQKAAFGEKAQVWYW